MGFFDNTRKPVGLGGKFMVIRMNGGHHRKLAEWGLNFLKIDTERTIADIGCGGGANINRMLKLAPKACLVGVDYSEVSVEKSKKYNSKYVKNGRCRVVQASADNLPFDDATLDLVTAFETIYFWNNIEECFAGIYKILNSKGRFMICNESDGEKESDQKWADLIEGMTTYSKEKIAQLLTDAGFDDVQICHDKQQHWLTVVGIKN